MEEWLGACMVARVGEEQVMCSTVLDRNYTTVGSHSTRGPQPVDVAPGNWYGTDPWGLGSASHPCLAQVSLNV